MLLCDTCDRECHTYCHYPVLWTVPKGEWLCPICKEQQLLKELHQIHLGLSQAKAQHEESMERKQRKVARLQKSGVLTQNILDDGEEKGRSRRQNRKKINYAELNDVYLPPLSPRELVGRRKRTNSEHASTRRSMYSYIQEDYLAPRVRTFSRRFRGLSPKLDAVVEEEVKLLDEEKSVASKEEEDKWEEDKGDEEKWEEDEGDEGKWEEDEGDEGKWEEEVEKGVDERKCVSLAAPTCSNSAVAMEAGVKEISILGKRSHDLLCHEDTYDDHITISSASSNRESVVGHGFNRAVANGSSTFATRKPLQLFGNLGSKDMKRNAGIRTVTKDKNSKLTEVCTMEEGYCMLHPHHSSHDALCHERAHSKDSTPASFSSMEEASP